MIFSFLMGYLTNTYTADLVFPKHRLNQLPGYMSRRQTILGNSFSAVREGNAIHNRYASGQSFLALPLLFTVNHKCSAEKHPERERETFSGITYPTEAFTVGRQY